MVYLLMLGNLLQYGARICWLYGSIIRMVHCVNECLYLL